MAYRPPQFRPSYEARRRAARRAGHIRLGVLVAVLALLIGIIVALSSGSSPAGSRRAGTTTTSSSIPSGTSGGKGVAGVTTHLLSWQLNSPLSRSVVLPAAGAQSLIVAGGLEPAGASDLGVYDVEASSGTATQVGNLLEPLHDAAGVVLGGKGYVFGGGTATPLTTVQVLPSLGGTAVSTTPATSVGVLPQPRTGASAVAIGGTAYLIGGMAATAADPAVLATSDGIHFATVAKLPVPVRDAAVAVLDGRIYVFGGDAANGAHAGHPVDTVQMIDPSAHSATVVGSLPAPVTGAAAATLAGVIYVAGGEAAASAAATPTAVKTVWAWLASSRRAVVAGHLEAAAAYAGLTVLGSQAWLVGGESAPGALLRDVQTFEPNPSVTVGATGAS
ncbi:MAG: kelch repeat-containing protein [Acidimicrobiales bacterium]